DNIWSGSAFRNICPTGFFRVRGCGRTYVWKVGAQHTSPGQRPGNETPPRIRPERAAQAQTLVRLCRPFKAEFGVIAADPGRCPGLICCAPSGHGPVAIAPHHSFTSPRATTHLVPWAVGVGVVTGGELGAAVPPLRLLVDGGVGQRPEPADDLAVHR